MRKGRPRALYAARQITTGLCALLMMGGVASASSEQSSQPASAAGPAEASTIELLAPDNIAVGPSFASVSMQVPCGPTATAVLGPGMGPVNGVVNVLVTGTTTAVNATTSASVRSTVTGSSPKAS